MTANSIEVSMAGQNWRLAVAPENEDALREAAALVEEHLLRIRNAPSTAAKGPERTAIMAALSIASQLVEERQSKLFAAGPETGHEMRARIESMHATMDRLIETVGQRGSF